MLKKHSVKILPILVIVALVASTVVVQQSRAAALESISDVMTDQTDNTASSHTISFTLPSTAEWSANEVIRIDMSPNDTATEDFVVTAPTTSDVTIAVDGATNDIAAKAPLATITTGSNPDCTGASADDIALSYDVTGNNDFIYLEACATGWAASDTGSTITLVFGSQVSGGSDFITNPDISADGDAFVEIVLDDGNDSTYDTTEPSDDSFATIAVPIILDGTVDVTATVDPTISFSLWTDTNCTNAPSVSDDVNLGSLPTSSGSHASSDASTVNSVCFELSSNATNGATIYVASANAALTDGSNTISSATATNVDGGTEAYGLCVKHDGTGVSPETTQATSPFNGTCSTNSSSTADDIGGVTTSNQAIVTNTDTSPALTDGEIVVKAAASTTTPAGAYSDTLTFTATGSF